MPTPTSSARPSRRTILCRSGVAAALLVGALSLPLIGGCGASTDTTGTAASSSSAATSADAAGSTGSASATSTDADTPASTTPTAKAASSADLDAASSTDGEVSANPATSSASASSDTGSAAKATSTGSASSARDASFAADSSRADSAAFDAAGSDAADSFSYSDYLDDNGYWKGVDALDAVTLPADYASIAVPQSRVTPTDEQVQQQIDGIVSAYAVTNQITDRAVADGDTVNIDYVGRIDGEEFEGGSTNGAGTTVVIGTTQYIDDFLEQLVGHMPGETFDIEVTFPETYGVEELNGKDATFTVTINYISEQSLPALTDDWVASTVGQTYGWTSVDAMREGIRDALFSNNLTSYVQSYLLGTSVISEMPQAMIDAQEAFFVGHYRGMADTYGMDFSKMLEMMGAADTDELLEKNAATIQSLAEQYLVFQAAAQDAGIVVSDEEARDYLASTLGMTDESSVDGYLDQYGMPYVKMNATVQAVTNLLLDGATIVDDEDATSGSDSAAGDAGESE